MAKFKSGDKVITSTGNIYTIAGDENKTPNDYNNYYCISNVDNTGWWMHENVLSLYNPFKVGDMIKFLKGSNKKYEIVEIYDHLIRCEGFDCYYPCNVAELAPYEFKEGDRVTIKGGDSYEWVIGYIVDGIAKISRKEITNCHISNLELVKGN